MINEQEFKKLKVGSVVKVGNDQPDLIIAIIGEFYYLLGHEELFDSDEPLTFKIMPISDLNLCKNWKVLKY